MDNIDLLTSQVEQHPLNPIVASILIDALMEERDMHRSEAEAHVVRVQEVAVDAAFLRRAAEIVGGCSWQKAWARDRILEGIDCPAGVQLTVVLVAGLQPPRLFHSPGEGWVSYWHDPGVTVGGQWVVREYREYLAWMQIHKRELREAKRK